jgi:uncharacterized protein (TIGR02001 family)
MKKLIGAAAAAGASLAGAGAAHAEIAANVSVTSDYVFRGVSLSDNGPAIQGGVDWTSEHFYAGGWASSVTEGVELDVYGGFTPTLGPLQWDIGAVAYFYPGADDDDAEFDYVEYLVTAALPVTEQLTVSAGVYFAPDNYGNTGEAPYYELNAEFQPMEALLVSGAFGNQTIENPDGADGGAGEDDYNTWNFGGTYAFHGFSLDLRYHDTDIDEGSDIEFYTYGEPSYDAAVVFTIGREL